jgi:hypothetical protein
LEFNEGYDKDVFNDFGYTQTRCFKQYLRDKKVCNNQQPSEDSGSEEPMSSSKEVVLRELSHKHELQLYHMREIQEAVPSPSLLLLPHREPLAGLSMPMSMSGMTSASTSSVNQSSEANLGWHQHHQGKHACEFKMMPQGPKKRKDSQGSRHSGMGTGSTSGPSSHYQPYPSSSHHHRESSLSSSSHYHHVSTHSAWTEEPVGTSDLAIVRAEQQELIPHEALFKVGHTLPACQSFKVFCD